MRSILCLVLASLLLFTLKACSKEEKTEEVVAKTCSSCHLPVTPASLPKSVWEKRVLPEMAARMGLRTLGYDPANQLPPGEYDLARAHGFYPDVPTMGLEAWQEVRRFILEQAPDTLERAPLLRMDTLDQFIPRPFNIDGRDGALVTYIGKGGPGLIVADGYGQLTAVGMDGQMDILAKLRLPLVHFSVDDQDSLLLEIGNIYPTEASNGKLYRLKGGGGQVIADSLHRPVHFLSEDLDQDGQQEIVVCEFGYFSGGLSLLDPDPGGNYQYRRLGGFAGSTRVVAQDLNHDGRKDLIVLHAQGDEGIDVLYQRDDGEYDREVLLRFPAVYGTSWFELVDYDGDGDQDLITVHGDNADYSNIIKPYHGVRIYANDGNNHFEEIYFQALPGATRVVARDFDDDGDVDLAVACNFADFQNQPEAAFVYLEQLNSDPSLSFRAATTPMALDGRWLIMEADDYDNDGDFDIALGSFTLNPSSAPMNLTTRWRDGRTDVLVLENLHR